MRAVEDKLDESFFCMRAERTTDLELQYLRAMAELGSWGAARRRRRVDSCHAISASRISSQRRAIPM
jgi:hypothetical protein